MARNPLVISGNQFNINIVLTIISQQGFLPRTRINTKFGDYKYRSAEFLPRTRINTGLVIAALFDQASLTGKTKKHKGRQKEMKKSLLTVGAACIAAASMMTGCGGNKAAAKDELQEFIVGSRAAEVIEKTNDKGIDAIASSSTIIYKRVGGAMREYIEKTRGDMATILLGRQIRNVDTKDADGIKIAEKILQGLTEIEKKDWTPEKLYTAAKEKRALQFYIASKEESKAGAKLRNSTEKLIKDEIAAGEKIYQATLAKEDWAAKIKEMEKLLNDLGEITKNTATLAQDIAQKITAKGNDIAGLAQDPAMQNFVKETAPLVAKKTFANDARKKEIDAEIATIAAKPEYKPIMDKKAQYEAELIKLKKDSAVLTDGIGKQCKYTGKAIPWLIKEYTAASQL